VRIAERGDRVRRAVEYGFGPLLIVILVSLAFQMAVPESDWARLAVVVLQGATLLLALSVSGTRRSIFHVAWLTVVVAIVASTGVLLSSGEFGTATAKLVTLMLVAVAPAAIVVGLVRHVRKERAVTVRTMFGVLCIYLLIGSFFSFCFSVVQHLGSTPFFTTHGSNEQADFLYFSFSTLTTTGYGDLVAATDVGRSLAIIEALVGQIYLVTVVALIVGNLRPRRRGRAAGDGG
jgi:Ion channel